MRYNNSFNLFLILIKSRKMQKSKKSHQEITNLIKFAYYHMHNLPEQKIRQAVILVSVHNGMQHVFKTLINTELPPDQLKKPQFKQIGKGIPLIYPTEALLNPNKDHNFVSMHYLLNTVQRAKFIFAFKHADLTKNPMSNVAETIKNFVSLFEKSIPNVGSQLSGSCGYIINEAKMGDKMIYVNLLEALHTQAGFISNDEVKKLAKKSVMSERIILFNASENKNKNQKPIQYQQMLSDLTSKLNFFKLPSNIEPGLHSAEKEFIKNKISDIWAGFFKKLYQNFQILITETKTKNQSSIYVKNPSQVQSMQDALSEISLNYILKEYCSNEWPKKVNLSHKALRLCKFIEGYLKIIGKVTSLSTQNYKETQELVTSFMNNLFDMGYLQKYNIYLFVVSFFRIQSFLFNCKKQQLKLIQRVNFKQIIMNPSLIDQKMSFLINHFYKILDQQIFNCDMAYPFVQIIQSICQILQILRVTNYGFTTERTFKKLLKYKAELAFRRANLVTSEYNIPKSAIIDSWIQFLTYAHQSTLIQPSKLERALSFIAEELTRKKSIKLALKVYSYLPEYKSYKKIIAIYERDLKFNPQIMKYTLSYDWPNKRQNFQEYCKFLLKIGFNEKVRGLCLEGLKVIEDDEEGIQLLKGLLISARGEQSRDIHNNFLHNLNEEEQMKIKIDEQLLLQLKDEFSKK